MRSIKKQAEELQRKTKDYKPSVGGGAQFSVPEFKVRVDETKYVKLLPIPDESTLGLFYETAVHWVNNDMVVCPGRICKTDARGFCCNARKLYSAADKDDCSDPEGIKKKAGLIRKKVCHIYYAMDVSPAFEKGGDGTVPACYGDDDKRTKDSSCADCVFRGQCQDKFYFIRYNFGSKGKSNGEKLMAAYNDDPDTMSQVFEVEPTKKGGNVKSRPIKIKVSGSSYTRAEYSMQPSLKEIEIPAKVFSRIEKGMSSVEDVIIEVATVPEEELLQRMADELSDTATIDTAPSDLPVEEAGEEQVPFEDASVGAAKPRCFGDTNWFDKEDPSCQSCVVIDACEASIK